MKQWVAIVGLLAGMVGCQQEPKVPVGGEIGRSEAEVVAVLNEWVSGLEQAEEGALGSLYVQILGDPVACIGTDTDVVLGTKMGYATPEDFIFDTGLSKDRYRKLAIDDQTQWYLPTDDTPFAARVQVRDWQGSKLWWVSFLSIDWVKGLNSGPSTWVPTGESITAILVMTPAEAIQTLGSIRDVDPRANGGTEFDSGVEVAVLAETTAGPVGLLLSDFGGSLKMDEALPASSGVEVRVSRASAPKLEDALKILEIGVKPELIEEAYVGFMVNGLDVQGCSVEYWGESEPDDHVLTFKK